MKKKKNNNIKKKVIKFCKRITSTVKMWIDKFKSLPSKVKTLIYVWSVVLVLIIMLIVVSSVNNNFLNKYYNIEKEMNNSALDYVKTQEIYPTSGNSFKLSLDVMKEFNYINPDFVSDSTCDGYSLIYYNSENDDYDVESYISCEKYTTKGYSENK